MSRIVNLTRHDVVILSNPSDPRPLAVIPKSDSIIRPVTSRERLFVLETPNGRVPVNRITLGEITDLPAEDPDTWLIVPAVVAQALREHPVNRGDLLTLDAGQRDSSGRILGVRALAVVY